ncbi:LLM class flavin-dependent oxidoreductase [Devosia sp. 2618]|uniref:LLM class flavin-dependent oxidoreductase n=1 Tax=Devosia sp. 2618 TaxID=3156454 RepID=UPI003397AA2C
MSSKQLKLVTFPLTGSASQAWRHPEVTAHDGLDINYYIEFAQLAERGRLDALFLYDGAGLRIDNPEITQRVWSVSAFEPVTLLSAIATHTQHIGLIYTASVSDNEPSVLARQSASLDHVSKGRAGWNIVTTPGPGATNFGIPADEDHDERYVRAREFYDVVSGLWDSFEDDALVRDKESGIFTDLSKVHKLNHHGKYYTSKGPLRVERPPQGHPVIAQAGSSGVGLDFGTAVADALFSVNLSIQAGRSYFKDVKARAVAHGRNPEDVKIISGVGIVWGETQEDAERRFDEITALWPLEVALGNLGMKLDKYDLDGPFPDAPEVGFSQGKSQAIINYAQEQGWTVRQTAYRLAASLGHRILVGTTQSIADDFETWLNTDATDGFVLIFPHAKKGLEQFVDNVVPELQRRGLFRTEYEGKTLRENLGLPRPQNRHVKAAQQAAE